MIGIGKLTRLWIWAAGLILTLFFAAMPDAFAQPAPAPSLVTPPTISTPSVSPRIVLPQAPAGALAPQGAQALSFVLRDIAIEGEFAELKSAREQLTAPLIGKRMSVADLFELASRIQQIYAQAHYPLARVVIIPQELDKEATVKLRVIDGFVERIDLDALAPQVRSRVQTVLLPLLRKTHLRQDELERQLMFAGETPGLILNAIFATGKETGGSVLILTGRYRPLSASVYFDNALPVSFGTGQAVGAVSLNNMLGLGEQLSLSVAGYPADDFISAFPTRRYLGGTFTIPLGIDGWKLEISGTNGLTTPRVIQGFETKGTLDQGYVKLSYDAIKSRDAELSFNSRFSATNEEIKSLAFGPEIPLSLDRTRVIRGGIDGLWRLREAGITVSYGATVSRGLDGLGARTAADASVLLPLSRQGADAVFTKIDGHTDVNIALPEQFFATLSAAGQSAMGRPLLTSEQFDLTGAKALSGFTSGSLPGDSAWLTRLEIGRSVAVPGVSGLVLTPYLFAAAGERFLLEPTALEFGTIRAQNYGVGTRFNIGAWAENAPDTYGFVEWSHRSANEPIYEGQRIFAGMIIRY